MTVKVTRAVRCSAANILHPFLMEQVAAAPLPAPDQDARSGGRPSDRDEALNNGTFPGHAPPLFPAGTETLQDFLGIGILEVTRPSRLRSSVRGPEEGARPPPLSLSSAHGLGKRREPTLCPRESATRTHSLLHAVPPGKSRTAHAVSALAVPRGQAQPSPREMLSLSWT